MGDWLNGISCINQDNAIDDVNSLEADHDIYC